MYPFSEGRRSQSVGSAKATARSLRKAFPEGRRRASPGQHSKAGAWRRAAQSGTDSPDDFLNSAEASIVFDCGQNSEDMRAFELVNKTNQFNLNGKRFNELEWRKFLADRTAFLLTASYKDKYGSLGKVVALLGRFDGRRVCVNGWVMSCRAFSRRIEYQCLNYCLKRSVPTKSSSITQRLHETDRSKTFDRFAGECTGFRRSNFEGAVW